MNIPIAPGVFDILPNDPKEAWKNSHLWSYVESTARRTAEQYGFQEIRTPIFERTELFKRGVGETSDIVSKEMYTFEDKGGRSMSLRPEGTAPAMRAFVEHQMQLAAPFHKLYYIGPMFRYERSQAGRYRQHQQFGAEAIGIAAPEQDVEMIDMVYTLYNRLGIQNLQVNLNSIGGTSTRIAFKEALKAYLAKYLDELSDDSKNRFETNPLRILDSKDPTDKEITKNAPSILDFLDGECRDHFETVQKLLIKLRIPFKINPLLVRGLDYYNKTVFEIVAGELGAQNSIVGGGRYDGLLKTLGGPDLPATGFATGLERVIQTMLKQNVPVPNAYRPTIFLIPMGDAAKEAAFPILHNLRENGIAAEMDFSGKKINKVMQYANQIQAEYVVVIGDKEIESGQVELKEMATGTTKSIPMQHLARIFQVEKQWEEYIKLLEKMQQPFDKSEEVDFFVTDIRKTIAQTEKVSTNLQAVLKKMQQMLT